jgi:hypothetical protein
MKLSTSTRSSPGWEEDMDLNCGDCRRRRHRGGWPADFRDAARGFRRADEGEMQGLARRILALANRGRDATIRRESDVAIDGSPCHATPEFRWCRRPPPPLRALLVPVDADSPEGRSTLRSP